MVMENAANQSQRPWALITGASAGIGAEFCRQLAAKGYKLVLVARRTGKLQTLADELKASDGTDSLVISADLSQSDACRSIVKRLEEEHIEIEYLVNNAGYGLPGSFHVPDWQEHADFIQVMMTAVCELTWRLLPGMRERGRGFIINIASVAALVPSSAGHTLYGASKNFLVRFSESLALENAGTGVNVIALCPGFTHSEFHDVNNTRGMVNQLPAYLWLDARDVVRDAIEAADSATTRVLIIPGGQYKSLVFVNRYLPWLARLLSNRLTKKFRVTD